MSRPSAINGDSISWRIYFNSRAAFSFDLSRHMLFRKQIINVRPDDSLNCLSCRTPIYPIGVRQHLNCHAQREVVKPQNLYSLLIQLRLRSLRPDFMQSVFNGVKFVATTCQIFKVSRASVVLAPVDVVYLMECRTGADKSLSNKPMVLAVVRLSANTQRHPQISVSVRRWFQDALMRCRSGAYSPDSSQIRNDIKRFKPNHRSPSLISQFFACKWEAIHTAMITRNLSKMEVYT